MLDASNQYKEPAFSTETTGSNLVLGTSYENASVWWTFVDNSRTFAKRFIDC